jgi:two-component system, LuxR family, sensor kinase FixL
MPRGEWEQLPIDDVDDPVADLARRVRIALLAWLVPIVLFGLTDLYLAQPQALATLYVLKLLGVATAVTGYWLLTQAGRPRRTVILIALAFVAITYALSAASAIVDGEDRTVPLISIAAALATATLLPWGMRPQLAVVVIAALASVVTAYAVNGSFAGLLTYPNVGLALGLALTVWVAAEFERSRLKLAAHHRTRQRAEAEVRELNEALEQRVAERTAELERVNQALQEQIRVRAAAEAELRQSEAKLSALIENTSDAIWSIDRAHQTTAFNGEVRKRFTDLFGQPLRPGAERDAHALEYLERHWRALYDRGLAGERFAVEHAVELPDGVHFYRTCFNPIVRDAAVTGLAIFSTDISDRKRAEEAARQHQAELTHVLRLGTMGEMAAGLAHEINQPLAAIVNYAQGCGRRLRLSSDDVDAVLPVIDTIAAEGLRAGEIIRRLRSLVRKETPRQDWFDLAEVAADALHLVETDAYEHGVNVRVETTPGLPRLLGDPIQIEQVVLNLLRNALDAMAEVGGRRELHVGIARVDGDAVELAVRDTGQGLTPAVVEHVFEPFFSTKPGGLGMGLSISRSIVEAHQGRLSATANADGGATFRVRLPVALVPATAASA